ncbi:helix-turn-helix domain-containing protein [Streptomyces sp. NPDC003401]
MPRPCRRRTAAAPHIHRTVLHQRFARAEELTGPDVENSAGRLTLRPGTERARPAGPRGIASAL